MLNTINNYCIHQLFEIQVKNTPDAIAVIFEEQKLTYRELNEKANQLAHYFKSLGVEPETLLGVYLERSLEMVIALLAILKTGAAYVPLDISYPTDRLCLMLEDSQARILLTQTYLAEKLPQNSTDTVCLDLEFEKIAENSVENLQNEVTPENLAYIIYTSGSTGRPKGVAMPHAPLCNLLNWQQQQSFVSEGSRTIQFTPISFDVSFQEIFSTVTAGGTLVLITEEKRKDPFSLLRFLRDNAIERLFLPFVALRQLAEVAEREKNLPSTLKEVVTAGEQLRITSAIARWFERMPNCTLSNHYGPSESHVVTSFTLTGSPKDWPTLPPIGCPISNTQIYILDPQLQPLAKETVGELYIGGDCLAKGYFNRPDLTAERFIPNHLTTKPEERLYKTGDLARYLPDGNIEYLGRIDQQIKIRGYRVEPGEIETVLEKLPKVKEAVVVAVDSKPGDKRQHILGDKRLVAYVVPDPEFSAHNFSEAPFARELRQSLRSQLPEYMIPSAFMILVEFPLTPSGKVNRRALPLPKWTRMEEGMYVEPSNPLEKKIANIWYQILGIEKIGIHDNFYELGGHSLLSVQMINRVSETFEVDLSFESFIKAPTIISLAKTINSLLIGESVVEKIDLEEDTKLDPSIYPDNIVDNSIPQILLTGTTGFLGSFLLRELIAQLKGQIYCLIRATSVEEARTKINSSLKQYEIDSNGFNSNIIPILGDLSKPKLGLNDDEFTRLAQKIDVIYHCGAWVNMVYPYSALKSANVIGTQEILRFASKTKIKPIHFISTTDVFSSINNGELRTIYEQDDIGPSNHLYSGYAQSKYVAEKLLMEAFSRGIPISIYRPSNITGDTIKGIGQQNSFVNLMIKGCLQMGVVPDIKVLLNLVPVDYTSKAIVYLSQNYKDYGRAFNIVNPQSLEWKKLINWLVKQGYSLETVSYDTWYYKLLQLSEHKERNALASMTSILANQNFVEKLLGGFNFQANKDTNNSLDNFTTCPKVDDKLLSLYFSNLVDSQSLKLSDSSKTGDCLIV